MPWQSGDGNRGGPWGVRGGPSPDLEELLRQGQGQLERIMPGGGPRGMGMILTICLLLAALGVWTAFYTVPKRFRRRRAALRQVSQGGATRTELQAAVRR